MLFIGADTCRNPAIASRREWLETNGLGGFASSTVMGLNTRRYHGLLCAALEPPTRRFMLLSKLDDTLVVGGNRYELSVNAYPGAIHPCGHELLSSFRMDPFPAYTWTVEDVELTKSIFLVYESNTVVVEYFLRAQGPAARRDVKLETRPLLSFRGYHELTHRNDAFRADYTTSDRSIVMQPYDSLPALYVAHDAATVEQSGHWYFNFEYQEEQRRGLDFTEDLFQPFVLHFDLNARPQCAVMASLSACDVTTTPQLRTGEAARRKAVGGKLAAAADQFIVKRGDRHSIIAGYPWFVDWGRDTMVSIPGLTLSTAHSNIAREILEEFSGWVRDGILPNFFPEAGQEPGYNSVDSGLWYFEAVRAYVEVTGDYDWVQQRIYSGLEAILNAYLQGTRYNIRVDADGLVSGGEHGVALTWMDARVNGVPITPRMGKPVEVQALWYNALRTMESFAARLDDSRKGVYADLADAARLAFQSKFWNGSVGCLFDVVDCPGGEADAFGSDPSIRPNQILALSLPHKMLDNDRARQILEVVERELLTPFGLRTLSPKDPAYCGRFDGDMASRDSAYHQGTVWPWLMGHFVIAWFDAHERDAVSRQRCLQWLSALKEYRTSEGMNQLPEVFDGDPPHRPGGCFAQAWSLAAIIQAFLKVY